MENISINKIDNYAIFPKKISINTDFSFDEKLKNDNNIGIISDIFSNENPSLFTTQQILKEFNLFKHEDINIKSEYISKDTLNITKSGSNVIKNIVDLEHDKEDKEKMNNKDKYSLNYLIRRAKKIIFDSLVKYDNDVISRVYDNNIGYGIHTKKLLRIKHSQIQNTNTLFNKELLKTPQGTIFSCDITTRYTNYPLNHNKLLINKLLNEENTKKRKIFNDLFSMTFLECIDNLIGKRKSESLKGLDKYYENEMIELDEEENFKEIIKNIINDFKNIFEKKKPRKTEYKKNK